MTDKLPDHDRIIMLEKNTEKIDKLIECVKNLDVKLDGYIEKQTTTCKEQTQACLFARSERIERNGANFSRRPTWNEILVIVGIFTGLYGAILGAAWTHLNNNIAELKLLIETLAKTIS